MENQKGRYYMDKKKVAIIFGGESSEHEISCISVRTIIKNIDKDKYDILLFMEKYIEILKNI